MGANMIPTAKKSGSTVLGVRIGLVQCMSAYGIHDAPEGTPTHCHAFNRCCLNAESVHHRSAPYYPSLPCVSHTSRSPRLVLLLLVLLVRVLAIYRIRMLHLLRLRLRHLGRWCPGSVVYAMCVREGGENGVVKKRICRRGFVIFQGQRRRWKGTGGISITHCTWTQGVTATVRCCNGHSLLALPCPGGLVVT